MWPGIGNDGDPFAVERRDDLRGKGFLQELAGAAHGPDLRPFLADHFRDAALGRDADPAAESGAAEDAHGAPVAVLGALARRAGGSGCVDEGVSAKADFLFPLFPGYGLDFPILPLHIVDAGGEVNFNPCAKRYLFTTGSMVATLYREAWGCPGNSMSRCRQF